MHSIERVWVWFLLYRLTDDGVSHEKIFHEKGFGCTTFISHPAAPETSWDLRFILRLSAAISLLVSIQSLDRLLVATARSEIGKWTSDEGCATHPTLRTPVAYGIFPEIRPIIFLLQKSSVLIPNQGAHRGKPRNYPPPFCISFANRCSKLYFSSLFLLASRNYRRWPNLPPFLELHKLSCYQDKVSSY